MALNLNSPTQDQSGKGVAAKLAKVGQLTIAQRLNIFGTFATLFLIIAVVAFQINMSESAYTEVYLGESGKLRMLSQRFAKQVLQVMGGDAATIDDLKISRQTYLDVVERLENGDEDLPQTTGKAREVLLKLKTGSDLVQQNIKVIEDSRAEMLIVDSAMEVFENNNDEVRKRLQQLIDGLSGEPRAAAIRMALASERVSSDAHRMLEDDFTKEQFAQLQGYVLTLKTELAAFSPADANAQALVKFLEQYVKNAEIIVAHGPKLDNAKIAGRAAVAYSDSQLIQAQNLVAAYQDNKLVDYTDIIGPVSAALVVGLMVLILSDYVKDSTRRAKEAETANEQNQRAILLLMNEFGDLADGDLTVRATVTEDITGAIADTLNFTTESFHKLVSRITSAADEMGYATKDADEVARGLMETSQKQAVKIMDAGESVQLITKSIQEVDDSAAKATEVGQRTLVATDMGGQAVRNTIAGMDGIREQIQDTSKRIKRLGERSQEIGEIVDLISDITEQTNVLALNAAIQATSAGEAGRGFSVVAEEVQRLAERSAEATKQIGALVKTIQSETQDAVVAMEKSTLGVVEGAKLSDVAGQSLKEIEEVSKELASLINSISVSTQVQTDMASEVASVMREILQITSQATEGTRLTTNFVTQLTSLANNLKTSVASFKL